MFRVRRRQHDHVLYSVTILSCTFKLTSIYLRVYKNNDNDRSQYCSIMSFLVGRQRRHRDFFKINNVRHCITMDRETPV